MLYRKILSWRLYVLSTLPTNLHASNPNSHRDFFEFNPSTVGLTPHSNEPSQVYCISSVGIRADWMQIPSKVKMHLTGSHKRPDDTTPNEVS